MSALLHPDTRIGSVSLFVSDLTLAMNYYMERLGFRLHGKTDNSVWLGADSEFLELVEKPGGRIIHGTTGLYHFAILVPSRRDLAITLGNLASSDTPLDGMADHLVSEAIYLTDLDGNGIEVYRDRPRSEWPREEGRVRMGTEPLDLQGIMSELREEDRDGNGLGLQSSIGHVHLRVADIGRTEYSTRRS